jgi:hypothetical protein
MKVFVAVQQHRRAGGFSRLSESPPPLAQQRLEVVDQQLLADTFGLGADQQPGPGGLIRTPKARRRLRSFSPLMRREIFTPWPWGWSTRKRPGRLRLPGEAGALGAGGLLHHLHQNFLAGFEQFGDACGPLPQPQGAQVGDMDETIFSLSPMLTKAASMPGSTFSIGAEVHITNLVAALGHHQFINTFVGEHCGDPQLLGDDDLLGHGGEDWTQAGP